MSRQWLRLVSLVNLVAFVFANAAGAITFHASTHSSACPCGGVARTQVTEEPASAGCKHCRMKQESGPSDEKLMTCPTCGCSLLDGSCKCKTAKESSPTCPAPLECPCPGGCVLCMAKVPCLLPASSIPLEAPCLGESIHEATPTYFEPYSGRLIRPPRA
jgi:hypothetical protein